MRAPHSLAEVLSRGEEGQEAHDRQSLASAEAPDRAAAGGLAGRGSAAGRSWVGWWWTARSPRGMWTRCTG